MEQGDRKVKQNEVNNLEICQEKFYVNIRMIQFENNVLCKAVTQEHSINCLIRLKKFDIFDLPF